MRTMRTMRTMPHRAALIQYIPVSPIIGDMPFSYSIFRDHLPASSPRTPPVTPIEPRRRLYRLLRGHCQPALCQVFYCSRMDSRAQMHGAWGGGGYYATV